MHETTADMLYTFLCRGESTDVPFLQRISHITSNYIKAGRSIDEIPVGDFFAPSLLDFTHGSYLCIDLDVFLTRQSKNRMIRKFGQQLRINRSKIKEAATPTRTLTIPAAPSPARTTIMSPSRSSAVNWKRNLSQPTAERCRNC